MTNSDENAHTPATRLRLARVANGYNSARAAADAMGVPFPTYAGHENGSRGLTTPAATRYADFFEISLEWLLAGKGTPNDDVRRRLANLAKLHNIDAPPPLAQALGAARLRLPVFGLASAGDDGRFLMNGQKIAEVFCPPILEGVPDAYATYVRGESMVPRYENGETVWVNPHLPVRKDDYVVAQIATDDPLEPAGFVKRFKGLGDELVLEQFNPARMLNFPRDRVLTVHKIVMSGES